MYTSQFKSTGLKDVLSFYSTPAVQAATNMNTSSSSILVTPHINTTQPTTTTTTTNISSNIENITPKKNMRDNHFSNGPLTDVKNIQQNQQNSSENSSDNDDDEKNLKVLHGSSPTSSPNFKSPKNKTLKIKRVKSIVNHLPAIKSMDDVVKLQEEITENRDKISNLQQKLSTVQKEKTTIEEEKVNLIKQLKELEDKQKSTEEKEKETKQLLVESENKLNSTIESLHQEFDSKISSITTEHTIIDNKKHQEIFSLKDQLSILQSKNQESLQHLEKIQKENQEKSLFIQNDKLLIEKLESDLKNSCQNNLEITSTLDSTQDTLKSVSKDLFFSTCLSIKLNLLMISKPCNLSTQDLWEQAEASQISSSNYAKWISLKLNEYHNDLPPSSPMKSIYTNKTTTTTTTTSNNISKSPKRNGKKK
ncbi:hypothetical protein RB653_009799 [Dictyostelium firmibasis]|uniref:Uncharacterized protein n=1 Tax=Dictyostelium firmibasis TaxID=79012 RepID=A0AAN7YLH1_9MYCE